MIDAELRKIADNFGKQLADSAAKHFSASMSASPGKNQQQYQPSDGRGGKANRSPLRGGGEIGSSNVLKQEVDALSKAFHDAKLTTWISKVGGNIKLLATGDWAKIGENITTRRIEAITGDAAKAAAGLSGVHKKLATGLIDYVKDNRTNIDELHHNTALLSEINKDLHKVGSSEEIDPGDKQFKNVIFNLENLTDAMGNSVDIFEEMPPHLRAALDSIEKEGLSRAKLKDATDDEIEAYNTKQEALGWVTQELETAADTIAHVGVQMTTSAAEMLSANKATIRKFMKGAAAAAGYGAFQFLDDTMYQYQTSIDRTYNTAAALMGMSHRQVQDAMLDYRDTLRSQAAMGGTDIYSDQSVETMKHIQSLGKTFGMIKDEAFRFGMQLKDTGRIMGVANMTEDNMMAFYGNAAKMMNMTVAEFGTHFNTMAKDPAFLAFINTMRLTGNATQESITEELANRIRMNKILGLSNENLQTRLNLENAKRWAPIVERYRSQIGVGQLIETYEQEMGVQLSEAHKAILLQKAFDPSTLTPEQQKIYTNEIAPMWTALPELLQEKLNKMAVDASDEDKQSVLDQIGVVKQMTALFGGMVNSELWTPDESLIASASLQNVSDATGLTKLEIVQAMADGTAKSNEKLAGYIATIAGDDEDPIGKGFGMKGLGVFQDTLSDIWGTVNQLASGAALSGTGKTISGLVGSGIGIAAEVWMHNRVMRVLGSMGGIAGKNVGIMRKVGVALGGLSSAAGGGTNALLLNTMGLMKNLGALSLLTGTFYAAYAAGDALYNSVKDTDLFTDMADNVFGMWDKLWMNTEERREQQKKEGLINNVNRTPEFSELTRDDQILTIKRRLKLAQDALHSPTASIANPAGDKQTAAIEELSKKLQAQIDAEAIVDTRLTPDQIIQKELLDEARKQTELTEKVLNHSKESDAERKGGFAQAIALAKRASESGKNWESMIEGRINDASLQFFA